ncbi:Protein kinase domain [Dillenia turbinata]|uniref:Protein kinase domain n=1 Tax=Dillenia turbinata TaxID=194707 RepID=A0AAN8VWR3_9MAGN
MAIPATKSPSSLKPKPRIDKSKWAAMVRNRRRMMKPNLPKTQSSSQSTTTQSSSDSYNIVEQTANPIKPRFNKSQLEAMVRNSRRFSKRSGFASHTQILSGPRWIRGSFIGKGTYGSVFVAKVINPTDEFPAEVAVKTAEISQSSTLKYEKQLLNMFSDCKQIINCYGDSITEDEKGIQSYNLFLELCAESLHHYIQRSCGGLVEVEIRGITRDIVMGISCIHCQDYVHCDIKPANILLVPKPFPHGDSGVSSHNAKICDFGLTTIYMYDMSGPVMGTECYLAPECIKDRVQGFSSDIWALGCVVLEMMTGKKVLNMDLSEIPELPGRVSDEGRDFLAKCLDQDPRSRWSASKLLKHPFIHGE